jgi:hypothetical protein
MKSIFGEVFSEHVIDSLFYRDYCYLIIRGGRGEAYDGLSKYEISKKIRNLKKTFGTPVTALIYDSNDGLYSHFGPIEDEFMDQLEEYQNVVTINPNNGNPCFHSLLVEFSTNVDSSAEKAYVGEIIDGNTLYDFIIDIGPDKEYPAKDGSTTKIYGKNLNYKNIRINKIIDGSYTIE